MPPRDPEAEDDVSTITDSRRAGVLAGALTLGSLPREARACGVCVCYANHEQPWAVPDASRSVPRNLRMFVWLRGMDPDTLALSTWAGEQVPFALTSAGMTDAYWLEPSELLVPSTDYRLDVIELVNPSGQPTQQTATFTSGTREDHVPPALSSLSISDQSSRGGMCGASIGSDLTGEGLSDDGATDATLVVELDEVSTGSRWFVPMSQGSWSAPFGRSSSGSECFGYRAFTAVEEGASYTVTATVWDAAGNRTIVPGLSFVATLTEPGGCPVWPPPDAGPDGERGYELCGDGWDETDRDRPEHGLELKPGGESWWVQCAGSRIAERGANRATRDGMGAHGLRSAMVSCACSTTLTGDTAA